MIRCTTFIRTTLIVLLLVLICISCAPRENEATPNYEKTKEMVVDILQTEEGKNALQEVLEDEEMKQQILINEPTVRATIRDTLLQEDHQQQFQTMLTDPQFAKDYAKQIEEQHKQMIKDLMKDPEYQTTMMDILQAPEMEQQFLQMTKTKQFRQQTMDVMKEAMENPTFRLELLELLQQLSAEEMKGGGQQEGGGEDSGGGQGEGGTEGDGQ